MLSHTAANANADVNADEEDDLHGAVDVEEEEERQKEKVDAKRVERILASNNRPYDNEQISSKLDVLRRTPSHYIPFSQRHRRRELLGDFDDHPHDHGWCCGGGFVSGLSCCRAWNTLAIELVYLVLWCIAFGLTFISESRWQHLFGKGEGSSSSDVDVQMVISNVRTLLVVSLAFVLSFRGVFFVHRYVDLAMLLDGNVLMEDLVQERRVYDLDELVQRYERYNRHRHRNRRRHHRRRQHQQRHPSAPSSPVDEDEDQSSSSSSSCCSSPSHPMMKFRYRLVALITTVQLWSTSISSSASTSSSSSVSSSTSASVSSSVSSSTSASPSENKFQFVVNLFNLLLPYLSFGNLFWVAVAVGGCLLIASVVALVAPMRLGQRWALAYGWLFVHALQLAQYEMKGSFCLVDALLSLSVRVTTRFVSSFEDHARLKRREASGDSPHQQQQQQQQRSLRWLVRRRIDEGESRMGKLTSVVLAIWNIAYVPLHTYLIRSLACDVHTQTLVADPSITCGESSQIAMMWTSYVLLLPIDFLGLLFCVYGAVMTCYDEHLLRNRELPMKELGLRDHFGSVFNEPNYARRYFALINLLVFINSFLSATAFFPRALVWICLGSNIVMLVIQGGLSGVFSPPKYRPSNVASLNFFASYGLWCAVFLSLITSLRTVINFDFSSSHSAIIIDVIMGGGVAVITFFALLIWISVARNRSRAAIEEDGDEDMELRREQQQREHPLLWSAQHNNDIHSVA